MAEPTPGRCLVSFLLLPFELIGQFLKALFFPAPSVRTGMKARTEQTWKQPTGYMYQDRNGSWRKHYYLFDEPPQI